MDEKLRNVLEKNIAQNEITLVVYKNNLPATGLNCFFFPYIIYSCTIYSRICTTFLAFAPLLSPCPTFLTPAPCSHPCATFLTPLPPMSLPPISLPLYYYLGPAGVRAPASCGSPPVHASVIVLPLPCASAGLPPYCHPCLPAPAASGGWTER